MVVCVNVCKIKPGMRDAFVKALMGNNLQKRFRRQNVNLCYYIGVSPVDMDIYILTEGWKTQEDFDGHVA